MKTIRTAKILQINTFKINVPLFCLTQSTMFASLLSLFTHINYECLVITKRTFSKLLNDTKLLLLKIWGTDGAYFFLCSLYFMSYLLNVPNGWHIFCLHVHSPAGMTIWLYLLFGPNLPIYLFQSLDNHTLPILFHPLI